MKIKKKIKQGGIEGTLEIEVSSVDVIEGCINDCPLERLRIAARLLDGIKPSEIDEIRNFGDGESFLSHCFGPIHIAAANIRYVPAKENQ